MYISGIKPGVAWVVFKVQFADKIHSVLQHADKKVVSSSSASCTKTAE